MQQSATVVNYRRASDLDFRRQGSLKDINVYPVWAQDMITDCADVKQKLLKHELWELMRTAKLDTRSTRNFLIGGWPVIDQFPLYMSMSLLKAPYGQSRGQDMARRWLIRNIRVEQNHAMYWMNWAMACGIKRKEVISVNVAPAITCLSHWCWRVCERENLAAAMAATNYAIEGASGEWASFIVSTPDYEESFPKEERRKAMHWLKAHATYDDDHPWEALEIICTIMGNNPPVQEIEHIRQCVRNSYEYYHLALDYCMR
jgi:pyrroloquinoline quinone (PQQ) biosynthesis protein C